MLDTLIVSDLHHNDKRCNLDRVGELFGHVGRVHQLVLAGDIIDSWLDNSQDFGRLHSLISGVTAHTIVVVRGNHDPECLRDVLHERIKIVDEYPVDTCNGKYIVIHGHKYDDILRNNHLIARLSLKLHQFLYSKFGIDIQKLARFSVSNKKKSLYFKKYIHESIGRMMNDYAGYSGVICGHTHYPIRVVYDDFDYINCGDLLENYSYVKVNQNGEISLCGYFPAI